MDHKKEYKRWLDSDKVDAETKKELLAIADDEDQIKSRFSAHMEFGTAGLRSTMAAGTSVMNVYTVAYVTQGLAELILSEDSDAAARGAVIAWDSRNNSELYSKCAASVLAANGIKTYIFDDIRPTPVLSYAIRRLGCISGINVTASHNPKQYNGYKVYWEDGAQLPPDHAATVKSAIDAIDIFDGVKSIDFDKAVEDGLICIIGEEIDKQYIKCVLEQRVNPSAIPEIADDLRIIYTPLHGTGRIIVPEVLKAAGLKNLFTVDEQMTADGNFPTVTSPNPENADALRRGIELAEKIGSDLVIATDPDADRVGVAAKTKDGSFQTITGNQMGALLLDYIFTAYEQSGTMPPEPYVVKTIVTSEMATKICEDHGIKIYNVLTGFKFIGEVIKNHEESGHGSFILGFEESYGYLKGTYARDKDAVVASMLICEMAAYYRKSGMTLCDALDGLYEKYGYYRESVANIVMDGIGGIEKMNALMEKLRVNPPKEFGGINIEVIKDYESGTSVNLKTNETNPTYLPKSNVLYYVVETGDVIVFRPSGTEPKIKIYILSRGTSSEEADAKAAAFAKSAIKLSE